MRAELPVASTGADAFSVAFNGTYSLYESAKCLVMSTTNETLPRLLVDPAKEHRSALRWRVRNVLVVPAEDLPDGGVVKYDGNLGAE